MYKTLTFVGKSDACAATLLTDVKVRIARGVQDDLIWNAMCSAFRRLCRDSEGLIYRSEQTMSKETISYDATLSNTSTPTAYAVQVIRIKGVKALPANRVGINAFEEISPLPAFSYEVVDNKQVKFTVQLFDNYDNYDGGLLQIDSSITIPRASSMSLVKEFMQDYPDALVYATCVELASQADRPWFSGDMLQYYEGKYRHELSEIYNDTDTGHKNTGVDVEG